MRLALLADVHGNLPALQAVLADARQRGAMGVLVAGDLVTAGPFPAEALSLLRSLADDLPCWIIRGNTDSYTVAYARGLTQEHWRTSLQFAPVRWTCAQLSPESIAYLASLPEQDAIRLDGAPPIRLVHGAPEKPAGLLYPEITPARAEFLRQAGYDVARDCFKLEDVLARVREAVMVCGHTHVPWARERCGVLAVNPGSVGVPMTEDARAQYALLTWEGTAWRAEHYRVTYDLAAVRESAQAERYEREGGALARAFVLDIVTGRNVALCFLAHARALAAAEGCPPDSPIPDDLWRQAEATFDWENASYPMEP